MFQRLKFRNVPIGTSILLFGFILLIPACYYNNEEDLYPGGTNCDLTAVSYTQDILPILQNNCYGCHDSVNKQGNVVLDSYDKLKTYVNNGKLVGATKRQAGFSPMPKGQPALPTCQVDQIAQWVLDGAPNN